MNGSSTQIAEQKHSNAFRRMLKRYLIPQTAMDSLPLIVLLGTAVALGVVLGGGYLPTKSGSTQQQQQQQRAPSSLNPILLPSGSTIGCPPNPGSFSTFAPDSSSNNGFSVGLLVSSEGTLCTLVEVSADGSFASPIARSYDGSDWEASAGRFASRLSLDCGAAAVCEAMLPALAPGAAYRLTRAVTPEYSTRDIAARFLEQATFGPTLEEMALFGDASVDEFADWILEQQNEVPVASHRAYYRQHMNARFASGSPIGPTTHPCQAGARYRWTAFSNKDAERILRVELLPAGSGAREQRVLSVDGHPRTIVEGPVSVLNFRGGGRGPRGEPEEIDWEDGDYPICGVLEVPDRQASAFLVEHPDYRRCVAMVFRDYDAAMPSFFSNPPVRFGSGISPGGALLDIPEGSVEPIDTEYYEGYQPETRDLILTDPLEDAGCAAASDGGAPAIARIGGAFWIHDPRFRLFENTPQQPLPDGGGGILREASSSSVLPVDPDFRPICANVPRTFLNEDTCYLSTEATACAYQLDDDENEDDDGPTATFVVSEEALRAIYESTGAGGPGTVYAYAIDGLDVTKDPTALPPCRPGAKSRWIPVECSPGDNGVAATTARKLGRMIGRASEKDENPWMVDIRFREDASASCAAADLDKSGFEIPDREDATRCWRNVHPDHWNVYDFTTWTRNHPGNLGGRNPIREPAEAGSAFLVFPDWHELDRWNSNKNAFFGPLRLGDELDFYELPVPLQTPELAQALGVIDPVGSSGSGESSSSPPSPPTLVCGSPYETANDPFLGGSVGQGSFDAYTEFFQTTEDFYLQREAVWTNVVLNDPGQLRQRAAWALSQILVVSPLDIEEASVITEGFLTYYDIFVRNAFGNYMDILKEVSYSRMMAEMLTYYGGQSTAFVFEEEGNLEFADENYAREIMQLFTTGLVKLNDDGSEVLDPDGATVRVYSNDDIEEYARVWTGFVAQANRGNVELSQTIDPMKINASFRDRLPKMGLDGRYVGDYYPLCKDLPMKHFLAQGATYRLLGGSSRPELHDDPWVWYKDEESSNFISLEPSSMLYDILCSAGSSGVCSYSSTVTLPQSVSCFGDECNVDTVRIVRVDDIYFEYIRPACVQQAFFNDGITIAKQWDSEYAMCADPRLEVATAACCDKVTGEDAWADLYYGERSSFETAKERCGGNLCSTEYSPDCDEELVGLKCEDNIFYWTSNGCSVGAIIDSSGKVAIGHLPEGLSIDNIPPLVGPLSPKTSFRVEWEGDYKEILSKCDTDPSCLSISEDVCACQVTVVDDAVFDSLPTRSDVLSTLSIGAFEPLDRPATTVGGVTAYNVNIDGSLKAESILEVVDSNGVRRWLKNVKSTAVVGGTSIGFRNPPHFLNLADEEPRDAHYETDAALEHYFYHPNTAPFLAIRFAQRFGISNPSPRYIEAISSAFRTGTYSVNGRRFGAGVYGDLAATFAAVLLDREARSPVLDADPSHGAFKEPLIKVLGLMRSLSFELKPNEPWVEFKRNIQNQIGQMAHRLPSVFSFFLPEYQPSGRIAQGSLVAPEAELLTGPRVIDSMNGILSLIRFGLNPCLGGFGSDESQRNEPNCDMLALDRYDGSTGVGELTYESSDGATRSEVIDELATLMTAGRLSDSSRRIIEDATANESIPDFVKSAQLLISTTPEFHATNLVQQTGETRKDEPPPIPSDRPYKAVVYFLLQGGYDSYNMLVPHSCTQTNSNGQTLLDQYNSERTSLALTDEERFLIIDATNQPCEQFAVHPELPVVERLYREGDLAFFANTGALDNPVTKENYRQQTRTELFAHNTMQQAAQRVDPWSSAPGTGIMGRMTDALLRKGFKAQAITVEDATVATIGAPGQSSPLIISPEGLNEFDVQPEEGEIFNVGEYVDALNGVTDIQSSIYGETWSDKFMKAILTSERLVGSLEEVELTQNYGAAATEDEEEEDDEPATEYLAKMRSAAQLILTSEQRGTDRDVIFVQKGGWDHHEGLKRKQVEDFRELNDALETFEKEMKSQGLWNQVTVVVASEFGRTLTANSGEGSDHAWGGNYFVLGGGVKGGKIQGNYPADITTSGPLNVGRGRLIPTLSWESMFQPILQWMGADTAEELDYCMPNRARTGTKLFSASEVFSTVSRTLRGVVEESK